MPLWEYKVITSGKGGFATPQMLEKFLNDLGREEWEIIHFHSLPENTLAFTGLVRRSTQRDWTLEDAAAAAARTEADKLRAEFEAKFKGMGSGAAPGQTDEKPQTIAGEKLAADDGMRRLRDTTRDGDPDADDEEPKDEWDQISSEDELPTFFDAMRPHMRRNQRGPGMSVGVEYLAKKWNLSDDDVKGALVECGFPLPEDEDSKPVYIEYEGDLYWLNINRRGELWLNTKEKPRPVFRTVQGTKVTEPVEESTPAAAPAEAKPALDAGTPAPAREQSPQRHENRREDRRDERRDGGAPATSAAPLPSGPALLERIRPMMRRNRRGAGGSGSTSFLCRGLKCAEADLIAAFATLGLTISENPADKPVNVQIGEEVWWLNRDQRGGVWINGREKEPGETIGADGSTSSTTPVETSTSPATSDMPAAEQPAAPSAEPVVSSSTSESTPTPTSSPEIPTSGAITPAVLPGVRLLLQETKTGGFAGKVDRLAEQMGKSTDDFITALVSAGLKVPEKSREKPIFVEHAGEIFWLNKNAKDELWLNAKASKFSDSAEGDDADRKNARRGRTKKKPEAEADTPPDAAS
jgi:hypothetical protein